MTPAARLQTAIEILDAIAAAAREGGAPADAIFAECRKLHPDSWNIFRETTERAETGLAVGDEFWGRVKSLGDKQYYATIDMPGMPG